MSGSKAYRVDVDAPLQWRARQNALASRIVSFVFAVGATANAGCGGPVAECVLDADCDQGQGCEASQCVPGCATDGDCLDDEVCLQGTTTALDICLPESAVTSGEELGASIVLIQDVSDACDGASPGADISFVVLEDHDGALLGWGDVVASAVHGDQNAYASTDQHAGEGPPHGADSCPELAEGAVTALGCEGYLAVRFLDAAGDTIPLRSDLHRIRVGERGEQCGDEDDDAYDVFLCRGATSGEDVPALCTVPVGSGGGERAFVL